MNPYPYHPPQIVLETLETIFTTFTIAYHQTQFALHYLPLLTSNLFSCLNPLSTLCGSTTLGAYANSASVSLSVY